MKYTIHEDLQLSSAGYENPPMIFSDGDIVETITADGSSHLFIVMKTEGGRGADCEYCDANKAISCLNYWFSCVGTHLKQIDTILEDL